MSLSGGAGGIASHAHFEEGKLDPGRTSPYTQAIKAVLKKIAEQNQVLELYLSTTIKTGAFCSYTLDPPIPVGWEFEG
jgi:hypothetical protein